VISRVLRDRLVLDLMVSKRFDNRELSLARREDFGFVELIYPNREAILVADDFKTSNRLVLDRIPVTSGTLE